MLLVIYGGYILVTFFAPVVRRKYQVWRYGPLPRDEYFDALRAEKFFVAS